MVLYKEQAYSDPSIEFVVACTQYLNHAVNLFVYTVRNDLRVKLRRFVIEKLKWFRKSKYEPNHWKKCEFWLLGNKTFIKDQLYNSTTWKIYNTYRGYKTGRGSSCILYHCIMAFDLTLFHYLIIHSLIFTSTTSTSFLSYFVVY